MIIIDDDGVMHKVLPIEVLDKISAEIKRPLEIERYADTDSAKAQAIALNWCIEIIDKYTKGESL